MILRLFTRKITAVLSSTANAAWFPYIVGLSAFFGTATLTVPVEWLVAIAVFINPARWIATGLWAAAGATIASLGLYFGFHHLGWELLVELYPDIAKSMIWTYSMGLLSEYGSIALFLAIALPSPVPKVPAIAFVAIYRMPVYEATLAIGFGELLRNVLYAYLASRFPRHFKRFYPDTNPTGATTSPTSKQRPAE